jgi:putative Mn2+ efflux pump MntP
MEFYEILVIAVGLAMDAFAVSLGAGASGHASTVRPMFRLSFHFGLFQFLMPVLGWYAGSRVAHVITAVDHWIAFGLLILVGLRMIRSAGRNPDSIPQSDILSVDPSRGFNLIMLSVATSIDALAVGLSLAMLQLDIWYPSVIIGFTTALLSLIGLRLGNRLGTRFGQRMERIGGILLIVIGVRILVEHLTA